MHLVRGLQIQVTYIWPSRSSVQVVALAISGQNMFRQQARRRLARQICRRAVHCLNPLLVPTTTYCLLLFPHSKPIKPHFFPICDMADQSRPTHFHSRFESALRAYEKTVGVTLAEHPLAVQLQSCHSIESITAVLQAQAQAFGEFRGSDRVIKSIKNTVSTLARISATTSLAIDLGLVCQQPLLACSTDLTVLIAIPTCESDIRRSRYPTCCMCCFRCSHVRILVIFKRNRRPRASQPTMAPSSTCSSLSNISFVVLIYIHIFLLHLPWTR